MVLIQLQSGLDARIKDISQVNEVLRRRLVDLGVMEGAAVRIKRLLPFGGPLLLEAAGQSIGVRRSDANRIGDELA